MNDGDALVAAITAQPEEDTPRLVYADWLDEREEREGEVWSVVADDIRYGVANPKRVFECGGDSSVGMVCSEETPCDCCFKLHQRGVLWRWLGEGYYKMRRGFMEEVRCSWAWWHARNKQLRKVMPITKVVLFTNPMNAPIPGGWESCVKWLSSSWKGIEFVPEWGL